MPAIVDENQMPFWNVEIIKEEPEQNNQYEEKYRELLLALAKAVSEAVREDPDAFYFLIYYAASVFQTAYDYLKDQKDQ